MQLQRLEGADLERTLADLVRAIVASLDPERILLFGSFARGDQNRASDFDLVVIAHTSLPFCDRIGRVLEACHPISPRRPVEALVYTPEEWQRMLAEGRSFAHHVEREARVLHERESKRSGGPSLAAETCMTAFARITSDPERMNGQPCIRDLRLTVRRVLKALAAYPRPRGTAA